MKQLINYKPNRHEITAYKNSRIIILLTLFCLFTFFVNICVLSAEEKPKDNPPLHVTSDSMLAKKIASTIEFTGNVIVIREDSTIHADAITMFFTKENEKDKEEKEKRKIEKIVALGNVKYFSEDRKAFADKAVYTYKNEVLVLTGNMPKVITGENFVTGKKITLFQKNGRVIIEGGVKATFNPDKKNKLNKE